MATCQQCQFLAPNEATSCPRCHAPFYAVSQFSIYKTAGESLRTPKAKKKQVFMLSGGLLVIALLGLFLFGSDSSPVVKKRSRKEPTDIQRTTAFQAFVPNDTAFKIRMPGKPERSETIVPELGPARPVIHYTVVHKDITFQVEQRVVPRYVPPYERDQALVEWFQQLYPPERYAIVSQKSVTTPAGDPAFDAVLVDTTTNSRRYQRMVSWSGNILTLSANWPPNVAPEPDQLTTWTAMSGSIVQR